MKVHFLADALRERVRLGLELRKRLALWLGGQAVSRNRKDGQRDTGQHSERAVSGCLEVGDTLRVAFGVQISERKGRARSVQLWFFGAVACHGGCGGFDRGSRQRSQEFRGLLLLIQRACEVVSDKKGCFALKW